MVWTELHERWVVGTTGSATDQQSTNDRKVAGSRPTKVVCITVLTGNRMGWTARCGRPPLLLPSCRKLEFRLSALMGSDLAWVNGKSGRQSWRYYADAFQRSIISKVVYHLPSPTRHTFLQIFSTDFVTIFMFWLTEGHIYQACHYIRVCIEVVAHTLSIWSHIDYHAVTRSHSSTVRLDILAGS